MPPGCTSSIMWECKNGCSSNESDMLIKRPRFWARPWFFCGICACILVTDGCGFFQEEDDSVVMVVGSRHITLDALKKHMEFVGGELDVHEFHREGVRDRLSEQIIDYYLILEYGKENGISLAENEVRRALSALKREYAESEFENALLREYVDVDRWRKRLEEQLLVRKVLEGVFERIPAPAHPEIERYYDVHADDFRFPRMVRFRQILTATKEAAEDLLGRIENGASIGQLARAHSIAPEAEAGGEVGWVAREELNESMATALFSMSPGEVSSVVKTAYGYHIFEVLSVRPGGMKPLPEVFGQIEAKLLEQKRRSFLEEWLVDLRTRFEVKVNQKLLNQLELS